jgi:hypothetical protein
LERPAQHALSWALPARRGGAGLLGVIVMSDLRVDIALLSETERSMQMIHKELSSCAARRDALAEVWGSDAVGSAMSSFVDNWDRHRAQLLGSIEAVGEMAAGCRDGFATVDDRLGCGLNPRARPARAER